MKTRDTEHVFWHNQSTAMRFTRLVSAIAFFMRLYLWRFGLKLALSDQTGRTI